MKVQQATPERSPMRGRIDTRAIFAVAVTIATFTISSSNTRAPDMTTGATGYSGRLVSIQSLQTDFGDMCYAQRIDPFEKNAALPAGNLFDAFDDTAHAAAQSTGNGTEISRPPVRTIRDTYPIYSSIAVDTQFNEIALQDTNLFGIKVFNRLENTPAGVEASKPT